MTFDPKEALSLVERLTGYTPGPWSGHNMVHEEGRQMTPVEIGEYVCNSVKMGDLSRFLFVSGKHDDGGDCDVCHTGNGPRGPANTALIAAAPDLHAALTAALDRIEALEAERDTAWNDAIEAAIEHVDGSWSWDDPDFMADVYDDLRRNLKKGEPT